MAFIRLEDMTGSTEIIVFPKSFDKFSKYLYEDRVIIVEGRAAISEGEAPRIVCENIIPFEKLDENRKPISIGIVLEHGITLDNVKSILIKHHGGIPLYVNDKSNGMKYKAEPSNWLDVSDELINKLADVLGKANVVVKYR